jgi:hypothetical protein
MRLALGIGVAVLIATRGDRAGADPAAPQVDPIHLQREDSERIDAQQRRPVPDRDPGSAGGAARGAPPFGPAAASEVDATTAHRLRLTSFILFGVAGAGALTSVPMFIDDPRATTGVGFAARAFAVGAAAAAGAGFTLFMASRRVRVAPAVSAAMVGLTLVGLL